MFSVRHSDGLNETAEDLAHEKGVSPRTVERAAKFARAVDTIADAKPEARQRILAEETGLSRKDIMKIAALSGDSLRVAAEAITQGRSAAGAIRDFKTAERSSTAFCSVRGDDVLRRGTGMEVTLVSAAVSAVVAAIVSFVFGPWMALRDERARRSYVATRRTCSVLLQLRQCLSKDKARRKTDSSDKPTSHGDYLKIVHQLVRYRDDPDLHLSQCKTRKMEGHLKKLVGDHGLEYYSTIAIGAEIDPVEAIRLQLTKDPAHSDKPLLDQMRDSQPRDVAPVDKILCEIEQMLELLGN